MFPAIVMCGNRAQLRNTVATSRRCGGLRMIFRVHIDDPGPRRTPLAERGQVAAPSPPPSAA